MKEADIILRELVFLKNHKDTKGKDSFYNDLQPKVWQNAFEYVDNLAPQPPTDPLAGEAKEESQDELWKEVLLILSITSIHPMFTDKLKQLFTINRKP